MKFVAFFGLLFFVLFVEFAFATNPTAVITSPTANQILSNVTNNGSMSFVITGTASDPDGDLQTWKLDYGLGSNPTTWPYFIASGTSQVINATFTLWQTQNITNQTVQIRLRVTDVPQHITDAFVVVTIGNFKMSQNVLEFNSGASGNVTYTSTIPKQFTSGNPLIQTIEIKNQAGTLARTLVSSVQRTGNPTGDKTYNDVWDGKNNSTQLVPEGAYFYTSTVSNGPISMTWDVSNQFTPTTSEAVWVTGPPTFDAFDNLPWYYSFPIVAPARTTLMFGRWNTWGSQVMCNDVNNWYCEYIDRYTSSGTHYGSWTGIDGTGTLRPDLDYSHVWADGTNFQKNAVVVFGNKPTITNLAFTPGVFNPSAQSQTISFTLATYQNQTAPSVVITFKNYPSATAVRTVIVNNVAAGSVNIPWDGKAANGKFLSPDYYLVTITLTDAIGNQEVIKAFTTVRY